jgi:Skp family chaperone for outer membrane proteins
MTDAPATLRNMGDKNAPHETFVTPAEDARTVMLNRLAWGPVIAGAVVALVTQLILNMLALGVGMASLNPTGGDNPSVSTFSLAAALWYIASGIFASFAGGYIAGRLSGKPVESTAGLHGLTAWALTTLVIVYLLTTTVGGIAGGVLNTISSAVGGIGRTATTAAQTAVPALANASDPFGAIERQVREASGGNDPAALRDTAVSAMRAALTGDAAQQTEARERAAQALSRAQNISIEQARTQIGQYEQQYRRTAEEAKAKALQAADTAAKAVSRGSLVAALALLLGALAGWFGGRAGTVDPTVTAAYPGETLNRF